jgi:hypothetical protein
MCYSRDFEFIYHDNRSNSLTEYPSEIYSYVLINYKNP